MDRSARIAAVGFDYGACELEPVETCNLCGSARHDEVSRHDRYGFPVRYVVCRDCRLGFLSPRPTAAAYGEFYAHVYRPLVSAFHDRRIDAETVQADQRGYAAELVSFLRETLPRPPRTVLDLGGSTGVVATAARAAFGAAATVLDPSPGELAVASAAGLETIAGFAETWDSGGRRFELILLCQTIDHLLDIAVTLAGIRRALAAGGRVFVDVLDVDLAVERAGSIEGAVKVDHPYYLNDATARAFFRHAGLDVTASRLTEDGHRGYVLAAGAVRR